MNLHIPCECGHMKTTHTQSDNMWVTTPTGIEQGWHCAAVDFGVIRSQCTCSCYREMDNLTYLSWRNTNSNTHAFADITQANTYVSILLAGVAPPVR